MSVRQKAREVLTPLLTTFAGLGGIVFHLGHGPEHFFCVAAAFIITMVGTFWGFYNRFLKARGGLGWHVTERCEKEAGHAT